MPSSLALVFSTSVLASLFLALPASAQTMFGSITGIVRDASGAVIPGAKVSVVQSATRSRSETATSSTGNYLVPNLPVGNYSVEVESQGFKTWIRSGIALSSNDAIRLDATLELGAIAERVEVTGEPPLLKTEATDVSSTVERKLVESLPLQVAGTGGGMRNVFSIIMMMPQVRSGSGESAWDDFQVGGGQQHDWNVNVDGLSVEMGYRNHVGYMNRLTPPIDAVEEFRLETAGFKAEDSRFSGGNITMVTKSGSNTLHGFAFDYYQSQHLNANTWQANKLGQPKAPFHRNDFGAGASGPVRIPGLYNGRDRTYFNFSYEGYRYPQTSGSREQTIPLPEMRSGDFSRWTRADGALIPIYDPSTTRTVAGGGYTREIFPGNLIPASRISPISRNIARYFPDPNAPGLVRNYRTTGTQPRRRIEDAFLTKLDHSFGVKNRIAFTWTKNSYWWWNAYDIDGANPDNWGGVLPYPLASPTNDRHYIRGDQFYGNVFRLNDTHMFSPTVVNTLTVGAHRLTNPIRDVTAGAEPWGEKLGGIRNNPGWNAHFPAVRFTNDNYYGWDSNFIADENHTVYGLEENLNWIRGDHSFKFGYAYQMLMLNRDNHTTEAGMFTFNRLETARPLDNSGGSGNSFASFMLGAVDVGTFVLPSARLMRWPYHAFYAQDDWKITPRLTANLGFRFEVNLPVYEKHDRVSYFDANIPNPAADGMPGGLRFLGNGPGREGRRTFHPPAEGYGPRAGLAFQLNQRTVIRAGAGLYYAPLKAAISNTGFSTSPSWSSPNQGVTPAFYWDDGFPAWTAPPFINPGFNTGFGMTWQQEQELGRLPTTANWNFAISRTLPGSFVLDVTYAGSKGTYLSSDRVNYMQIDPKYAALGSLLNRPIDDPAVAALGFKAPFPSFKSVMGSSATLGQSLRMFPQYTSVGTGGMWNHSGNSTYHSMILKATKRYTQGLSLVGSYVWSKLLTDADSSEPSIAGSVGARVGAGSAQNHYNRGPEKSYGVLDTPHHFKLTASYDLPFGKGRKYTTPAVVRHIVGGWNLSSFVFAQSGFPMGVIDTGYNNFLNGGTARPNVLSNAWRGAIAGGEFDPDKDLFYDRSVFARRTNPALDPFGSAPRFSGATRMFRRVRENAAFTRRVGLLGERVGLDLRWEIFNLFNHKTWNLPASQDLANTQFGRITAADGNRSMQLGLKVVF